MSGWLAPLGRHGFFASMAVGAMLIALASVEYFDSSELAPFVIEKLPVRFETLWMTSLQLHVASAVLTFPLCLLLMTRWLQRRRSWHRWIGRAVGLSLVFAVVPTGVVLAFAAKGGIPVTVGFLISAAIVLFSVTSGVVFARRGEWVQHARAMRHVVAQMSVAVSSRAMLVGLGVVGMHPETAYVVALWFPVLASALAAEVVSGRLKLQNFQPLRSVPRSLQ